MFVFQPLFFFEVFIAPWRLLSLKEKEMATSVLVDRTNSVVSEDTTELVLGMDGFYKLVLRLVCSCSRLQQSQMDRTGANTVALDAECGN